jgi:hypothetical protein
MTWKELCRLARALPEVSETVWYRTPALAVRGKSFVRLKEDGATVVFLVDSVEAQELLIRARPRVYYITDHYRGYPAVLARLSRLGVREARERLAEAWRRKAPRRLLASHDPSA